MVLLIGRERVSTAADAAHVASHAALRPAHAAFRAAGIVDFRAANAADSAAHLVVLQRECGSAVPGQFALVGSEDATTCHVVFVQRRRYRGGDARGGGSSNSGGEHTIAVAHLDDDEADKQMAIVMKLFDEPAEVQHNQVPHELPFASPPSWSFSLAEQSAAASVESLSGAVSAETQTEAADEDDEVEFDVHIVGGYQDEEETSIKISNALMRYLVDSPHVFRIRLFFTGADNTIPHPTLARTPHPWTRGAMMDTRTSRVFAYQSAHSSARAARLVRSLVAYTRPPVLLHVVHRAEGAPAADDDGSDGKSSASSSASSSFCSGSNSAISPARPLAATAASAQTAQMAIRGGVDRACLTLGPYAIAVPRQIALCARLPDEALLRTCSTSPTAEHARFPAELRALYGMMLALARGDLQPPFPLLAQRRFRRAWVPAPASPKPVPATDEEVLAAGEWRWVDSATGAPLDY